MKTTISTGIRVDKFPQEEKVTVECPNCAEQLEVSVSSVIALICTKCGKLFNGFTGEEYEV